MAWVQVGLRKINTANVCYLEQNEDNLVIHFQGNANILTLTADEAKNLWRHLKAEDAMYVKDKGSAMVLQPKRMSAPMPVVLDVGADKAGEDKAKAPAPASAAHRPTSSHGHGHAPRPPSSSHSHGSSSHSQGSSSHSQSHSHSQKPAEVRNA